MASEQALQIAPIVQESVMHNSKTLHNLQSLTASLFGVAAGVLGLESYSGFLFYLVASLLTSLLFFALRVAPTKSALAPSPSDRAVSSQQSSRSASLSPSSSLEGPFSTSAFFRGPYEIWTGGIFNGLAGFILTWTLFYGLVRA